MVLKQLGTPTAETWPDLASLPDYNKITFPYHIGASWEEIISDATPEALDIIKKLLLYDSSKRLNANEVRKFIDLSYKLGFLYEKIFLICFY